MSFVEMRISKLTTGSTFVNFDKIFDQGNVAKDQAMYTSYVYCTNS